MDIQFYGANCVVITTKQARLVVDDNLAELGGKAVTKEGDIVLYTGVHKQLAASPKLVVDQTGEYEVAGASIYGIAARSHIDEEGQKTATMYKIMIDDINLLITGHIFPELSDDQLESIGMVDVVAVPVGGNGYTLDGVGALKIIKKIEPKLVIPTHYEDPALQFTVPQQPLVQALQGLAMEPREAVSRLRLKASELGEVMQLAVLERS